MIVQLVIDIARRPLAEGYSAAIRLNNIIPQRLNRKLMPPCD